MPNFDNSRLYARVADDLRRRIKAGHYAIGERLPAERVLTQDYDVSRPTLREALFALELDGMVEVRVGSGVYVKARSPFSRNGVDADLGPFEMLEARRAIEGEACAIAALRISDAELAELEDLLLQIESADADDVVRAEMADRRFHETIARATQNSGIAAAVEMLWEARAHSRECQLMGSKARAAGVTPRPEEHRAICDALRARDAARARTAMHQHLTRVLDSVMQATEVQEVEQAKERVARQRRKFAAVS